MTFYKTDFKECISVDLKSILAFILFFSLFFNTGTNVFIFYIAFVVNVVYLFFCVFSKLKLKVEPFIFYYLIFFCWACLSLFWAKNFTLSINMVFRIVILLFTMMFVINLEDSKDSLLKGGFYGLLAGVFVNVPLTFIDSFYTSGRFSGTTINPNHVALFSGFVIFLSIMNKDKLNKSLLFLALILSTYLVLQTGSRKGLLLVIITISIYILKIESKKAKFTYAPLLITTSFACLYLFISNLEYLASIHPTFIRFYELTQININDLSSDGFGGDSSTRWRLIFIVEAFGIFLNSPLTGIGLDNFKTIFSEELYSHNNYVELLSTLGLVGLVTYYTFLFSMFKFALKIKTIFSIFLVLFFLFMDFAMVSYFERMFILPLILIYYTTKREYLIESSTHN